VGAHRIGSRSAQNRRGRRGRPADQNRCNRHRDQPRPHAATHPGGLSHGCTHRAEHLLAARASNPAAARALIQIITRVEAEARALGLDIRGTQPSPGNIRGGLTTIEEKSLGATHKGGERSSLEDVVPYAGKIARKGLTVMDTPGLDVESVTGMVGGGAQVVVSRPGSARQPATRSHR